MVFVGSLFFRDGNDLAGVRTPEVAVPLATHLSWNLRDKGYAPGQACGGQGATIPFAWDRPPAGDPRESIKARYPTKASYIEKVGQASQELVRQRLMLEEDALRWTRHAEAVTGW
jgi:hypothetical protein